MKYGDARTTTVCMRVELRGAALYIKQVFERQHTRSAAWKSICKQGAKPSDRSNCGLPLICTKPPSIRPSGSCRLNLIANRAAAADTLDGVQCLVRFCYTRHPYRTLPPMPTSRGLKALGVCLAWMLSLPAWPASPDLAEQAVRLDQGVEALKDEVIEFNREASSTEVEALLPDYRRLNIYLRVKVPGLLLDSITVQIDDRQPEIHHYDEYDSRALLGKDSMQRLLRVSTDVGVHKVKVSFKGKLSDAKPEDPPLTDQYEARFDKTTYAADLEFIIANESRFRGHPRLALRQWRASQ